MLTLQQSKSKEICKKLAERKLNCSIATVQLKSLAFNGNDPFPFYIHIIEELVAEVPVTHHFAGLDKPVGKGRLAMINMGYDAKVPDIIHRGIKYLFLYHLPSN